MTRKEFMERLELLLQDISDSEREEALQYYNDYFDDAGPENEATVVEELGSPEQVAQKIKAGLSESASEYTETGYEDTRFRDSQEMIPRTPMSSGAADGQTTGKKSQPEIQKTTNFWKILAIVLFCVIAAPVILPVGAGVLAVIAAVVIGLLALCFGITVAGFAILIAGVAVIVVGITKIFILPAAGITIAGVGFLLLALGLLVSMATIWCGIKVVPWLIRGIVGLFRYPFRKAGAKE